jgi:hypothetical protein
MQNPTFQNAWNWEKLKNVKKVDHGNPTLLTKTKCDMLSYSHMTNILYLVSQPLNMWVTLGWTNVFIISYLEVLS